MTDNDGVEQPVANMDDQGLDLTHNQLQFAESLNVDVNSADSLESVIQQIERALGQRNIRELTRWFLMSVYRHSLRAKWNDLADSGISESTQTELVDELVASDDFKQSILTVLKDIRCRYTLLTFGKTRDPANRSLANSTKAFKQARQLLRDVKLLKSAGKKSSKSRAVSEQTDNGTEAVDDLSQAQGMAVNRRAARRGYSMQLPEEEPAWEKPPSTRTSQEDPLSDEEFQELDKVLKEGGEGSGQRFTYNTNEERLSLLLGVLAGFAVCVVLLWVIY